MVVDNPKSKTLKYAIIDPNNLYKPNSEIPIKINKIGAENYSGKMYFCMVLEVEKLICRYLVMKMENLFKI